MNRATLCVLALIALATPTLSCDGGGGGGGNDDTVTPADAAPDTASPQDILEDNLPPPLDSLTDTPPPPEDSLTDTPPLPDTLEDILWDLPDIPWDLPDIPWDLPDIPDLVPDIPCEWPVYSTECEEIPDFQCGFMATCEAGVLHAEWHEHIFCEGEEQIVDYWCEHVCAGGCEEGEIVDWPVDGEAFVADFCKAPPDCVMPPLYPGLVLEDILADPAQFDGEPVAF